MRSRRPLVIAASLSCVASAAAFAACGGGETQPPAPDASTSVSADIGPNGGSVAACGSVVAVPPGSLATTQTITVSCDPTATVAGYALLSPLYRFQPEGLTFARPVTVTLAFAGTPTSATSLYWSRAGGSGYDAIASSVQGAFVVGTVTHFSTGFVGQPGPPAADGGLDAGFDATLDTGAEAGPDAPFQCTTPSDPPTVGVPCGTVTCTGEAGVCFRVIYPSNTEAGVCGAPDAGNPVSGAPGLPEACDGPEDCPAGQMCLVYRPGGPSYGSFCGIPSNTRPSSGIACHSSSDCPRNIPVCELPDWYFPGDTYPTFTLRTCTTPCTPGPSSCSVVTDPSYGDAGLVWVGGNCFADPGCGPTCHQQVAPIDAGTLPDGCVTPVAPRGFMACHDDYPFYDGGFVACNAEFQNCMCGKCLFQGGNPVGCSANAVTCGGPESCASGQYCDVQAGCVDASGGPPQPQAPSGYLCHSDADCPPDNPFCYPAASVYAIAASNFGMNSGNCWSVPPAADAGVVYGSCGNELDAQPPSFGVPCGATTCTSPDQQCCQTGNVSGTSPGIQTCVPRTRDPVVSGGNPAGCAGNPIQCDGPEDCVAGTHCTYASYAGNGPLDWVFCSGSAVGATVCHAPADCPADAPYCWSIAGKWGVGSGLGSYPLSVCSSSDAGL
jgi:hypothetical protein